MPGPNHSRRRRRAIDRHSATHGPIETAAAAATGTAIIIATAIGTAAGTARGAYPGATVRATQAAIRGATVRTAMLPHAREMRRGARPGGTTVRAATLRLVRKVRAAMHPAPINRRAPTAPLVATTHLGPAIETPAGSSVRAASGRDAADVGVDVVDAMVARMPAIARRAMTRLLRAAATAPAGRSSRRDRMRAMPLLAPRLRVILRRPRDRKCHPGRTRQPPSNARPRCRRRRGRSNRHKRRPGTTASMSYGRRLRAMCRAAVPTTASPAAPRDSG
jgi:hypothetical protein